MKKIIFNVDFVQVRCELAEKTLEEPAYEPKVSTAENSRNVFPASSHLTCIKLS